MLITRKKNVDNNDKNKQKKIEWKQKSSLFLCVEIIIFLRYKRKDMRALMCKQQRKMNENQIFLFISGARQNLKVSRAKILYEKFYFYIFTLLNKQED